MKVVRVVLFVLCIGISKLLICDIRNLDASLHALQQSLKILHDGLKALPFPASKPSVPPISPKPPVEKPEVIPFTPVVPNKKPELPQKASSSISKKYKDMMGEEFGAIGGMEALKSMLLELAEITKTDEYVMYSYFYPFVKDKKFFPQYYRGYLFIWLTTQKNVAMRSDDSFVEFLYKKSGRDKAVNLAGQYKIHLMPEKKDLAVIMYTLMSSMNKEYSMVGGNTDLGGLVGAFKIRYPLKKWNIAETQEDQLPYIVIYPGQGKVVAQEVLNRIYKLLGNIEGTGIAPRYNTKVTDLIWIAQGDADYKKESFQKEMLEVLEANPCDYYECPSMVYYNKENITSEYQQYKDDEKKELTELGERYKDVYAALPMSDQNHYLIDPKDGKTPLR